MAVVNVQVVVDTKTGQSQLRTFSTDLDKLGKSSDATKVKLSAFDSVLQGVGQRFGQIAFDAVGRGFGLIESAITGSIAAAIEYESAFAGVRKTVEASPEEFARLSDEIRRLSTELPITASELAGVTEAAGQLGIKNEDLVAFTDTMARLGISTNLSASEAADSLARFNNIVANGRGEYGQLGSTIVALGNQFAGTEQEIVAMALRIAGAGNQLGMTQGEVLAFATALSSVGIEAEAGGTAISKVMIDIASAVSEGGQQLDLFAQVAGKSSEEFKQAFSADAAGAVKDFIVGLADVKASGGDVLAVLKSLGIEEVRMRDALLRTSAASTELTRALDVQQQAWSDNTALNKESEERVKTAAAQWEIFKNQLTDVGIEFGSTFLPALQAALSGLREFIPVLKDAATESQGWADVLATNVKVQLEVLKIILTGLETGLLSLSAAGKAVADNPLVSWLTNSQIAMGGLREAALNALGPLGDVIQLASRMTDDAAKTVAARDASASQALALKQAPGQMADLNQALLAALQKTVPPPAPPPRSGIVLPPSSEQEKAAKAAAKAAEQLAKDTTRYAREIDDAFAQAGRSGLTELEQSFLGVDAKVRDLQNGLDDYVAKNKDNKNFDPAQVEAFSQQIGLVAERMREAALEAQRMSVIGETLDDVNVQARNVLQTFAEWEKVGGGLTQLTDQALVELEARLDDMADKGAPVGDLLADVRDRMGEVGVLTADQVDAWNANYEASKRYWDDVLAKAEEAKFTLEDFYNLMTGVGDLLNAVGVGGGDTIHALVGEFQQIDKWASDGVLAFEEMPAAIAGVVGAFKQATDSASGFQRALGGAALGAKLGQQFGGAWGAAIGAVIGGVAGLFRKPSWAKVGEEAGRVLGVAVSKELAQAIEKTSKDLNISVEAASLLHITDAMDESKQSASAFAGQINQLMQGIAAGTVPVTEGLQQLEDVFSRVREGATGVGDAMTVAMLEAARATGTLTEGMQAFISEQNQLMAGGASKIASAMENIAKVGGPVGERAALFFKGGFEAAIAEQGLLGAVETLGDQAVALFEKFKKGGNATAAAMIAPFANIAKQLGGDSPASKALRGQVELLQGMGEVFEGAANQGLLTPDMQAAFGAQLNDTLNALMSKGIDAKTSMTAIVPEITKAVSAAQQLGVPLDANTASLKAQAEAMGFAFPTEPLVQVVDLLKTMVQGMGFELPASAQAAASSIGTAIPNAAATASSSMGSISSAAIATSNTVVQAFDGVGAQIATSITPVAGAIESQLVSAFDAGIGQAQQFVSFLSKIDSTTLTIPFKFTGDGGLPGGGITGGLPFDVPMAAKGLTVDPKPGGQLLIAGEAGQREHVIPDPELKALLKGGGGRSVGPVTLAPTIIVQGAPDAKETARLVMEELDSGAQGFVTKIERALEGRR